MSPEQAAGRWNDVGPATDVYSLGATLYAMLTGQPPFRRDDPHAQPESGGGVLARVQRGSFAPPRQLNRRAPPALEAICLKAMALQPTDRYATARALAEDIERWLADEPVTAYRTPLATRLSRWGRKHRTAVASGAVLLLTSVIGLGIGLFAVNAERRVAEESRDLARRRYDLALTAYDDMVNGIQEKLEARSATHELRQELLERARVGLKALQEEAQSSGAADSALVSTHFRMGLLLINLGKLTAARDEYRQGLDLAQRLAAAEPESATAQHDLSTGHQRMGNVLLAQGETAAASQSHQRALEICLRLRDADSKNVIAQRDVSVCWSNMGEVRQASGDIAGARDAFQEALAIGRRLAAAAPEDTSVQSDLSVSLDRLGDVLVDLGDVEGARKLYEQSRDVRERLAEVEPANDTFRRSASISHFKIGTLFLASGAGEPARDSFLKARDVFRELAEADPLNATAQRDFVVCSNRLGDVQFALGETAEAKDTYEQALSIVHRLAAASPENVELQDTLANSYEKQARVLLQLGETSAAQDAYRQAIEICRRLAAADPQNAGARGDLVIYFIGLADLSVQTGDLPAVRQALQDALPVASANASEDSENVDVQSLLACVHLRLGSVNIQQGDFAAATTCLEQSLAILEPLEKSGKLEGQTIYQDWLEAARNLLLNAQGSDRAATDLPYVLEQPLEQAMALLLARLRDQLRRQDVDGLGETAQAMQDRAGADNNHLYNTACAWSLCVGALQARADRSPEDDARLEHFRQRALATLAQSLEAGFPNVGLLRTDADLAPIRDLPEFQALLK